MNFGRIHGIGIRHTSPYNPQSNPVERVMRELGRIIRAYAHSRQTTWSRILERAEDVINDTEHRSTGMRPVELHENVEANIQVDDRLQAQYNVEKNLQEKIEGAYGKLRRRAQERKRQADKHEEAKEFQLNDKVWIKLHRRSDKNRRLTKKIHLVYEGPYIVMREIRTNAYLIGNEEGNTVGVYNTRQLKPHREPKLKPIGRIAMIRIPQSVMEIAELGSYESFCRELREKVSSRGEDLPKKERDSIPEESVNPRKKINPEQTMEKTVEAATLKPEKEKKKRLVKGCSIDDKNKSNNECKPKNKETSRLMTILNTINGEIK